MSRSMGGGTAIVLAYGLKIEDTKDPFVDLAQRAFQAALDSAFLVDVTPLPRRSYRKASMSYPMLRH
ncbi:hypothetical protein CPB84DRAFT_1764925 [Gymnopilus junonius]|uniref:Uncharacterized protein n=1 Tax=Gymnopilus junonius TaxID=109634 RepID=A0A9P5P014_GYMJU|nr:hypothetical protein CPB84DRAFT_1764925 [Gymnopilus junonius]